MKKENKIRNNNHNNENVFTNNQNFKINKIVQIPGVDINIKQQIEIPYISTSFNTKENIQPDAKTPMKMMGQ